MGDRRGFFKPNATNYRFSDILAAVGVAQLEKAGVPTAPTEDLAGFLQMCNTDGCDNVREAVLRFVRLDEAAAVAPRVRSAALY